MKFSVFTAALATALSASSTFAAPTDTSSSEVESRQAIPVIGAVVSAYTGIATAIIEQINKDNKVCLILPGFRRVLTLNSRIALHSLNGPSKRWPATIPDGTT
jgi:hypothetical protein